MLSHWSFPQKLSHCKSVSGSIPLSLTQHDLPVLRSASQVEYNFTPVFPSKSPNPLWLLPHLLSLTLPQTHGLLFEVFDPWYRGLSTPLSPKYRVDRFLGVKDPFNLGLDPKT